MLTLRRSGLLLCCLLALLNWCTESSRADEGSDPGVTELNARIAELNATLVERPGDVELLIDLGNAYYEGNMLDQALASYESAAALDSTHAGAQLNMGSALADMGELDRSIVALTRARDLDSESALIASTLGSAYYGKGRFAEAVEMYEEALRLDPKSIEGHFNLGVAFADAQLFEEAIREWREVISVDPEGDVASICRENIKMMTEFLGK